MSYYAEINKKTTERGVYMPIAIQMIVDYVHELKGETGTVGTTCG